MRIWNFEQKNKTKKKQLKKNLSAVFWLNEECPKLFSGRGIDHQRRKTIPLWYSSGGGGGGGKEFFRASLYVWCLQYWALCDALVDFKLWAGVRYLSFSIDIAPECILWKRSREDRSLRASRDGHTQVSQASRRLYLCFAISCRSSRLLSSELSLPD